MQASIMDIFGWHFDHDVFFENERIAKKNITYLNVAGYIPLIGIISGIYRASVFGRALYQGPGEESESERIFYRVMFARGIFESVSCGALLLPVDLTITLIRETRFCREESYLQIN